MSAINPGRAHVASALSHVVKSLFGRSEISELKLRDAWLEEIEQVHSLTTNGWYDPPVTGAVILSCTPEDTRRSHFKSFRDPASFSREEYIDWSNGIIIAYASNVDRSTGIPADFATTAYFGNDFTTRQHLRTCFSACRQALAGVEVNWNAGQLYNYVHQTMLGNGLDGKTWSTTDNDYNYGHSLPRLIFKSAIGEQNISRELAFETAAEMRNARRFVSQTATWLIAGDEQFTIEPQCVAVADRSLPKTMIHYVATVKDSMLEICDCCEQLPREFDLI